MIKSLMMQPLDKTLRNKLERTVKEARDIAEAAAKTASQQIGVGEAKPFDYLSEDERNLRRRLRTHGRQLGDRRNTNTETQEIGRLIEEVGYEHWHRMLFARFLAENNLLMYPDPDDPVAVSLEECEDLASEEGSKNGWELAARYATRMLPQIFRIDSPVFELLLPPEHQQTLEQLLTNLESEVFLASDSLGWVYQFWQSKRKDDVNASEVKIGARELPAVTQLFTEAYMVSFLLDNSLGAWWAGKRLSENNLKSANSEEELRNKAALPNMPLEYLRFVKKEDESWTPAAGTFERWPEKLSELKALDPCCGSGHFLVAAFLMLVPMRMELEGLSTKAAVDAVLTDNLNGLEIDQRCVELAVFALALTAWRYPDAGGYRLLPEMNLACSGLSVSLPEKEWKELAGDDQNLKVALEWLFDDFKNAPVLGSLINPLKDLSQQLLGNWNQVVNKLKEQKTRWVTDEEIEAGVVAHGMVKAALLLSNKYNLVITNVPYLARGKQNETLKNYSEKKHNKAKNDLATVFLDRCLDFCVKSGTISIVLPQNWLFLTSYKKFRENLLIKDTWHLVARLGEGGFDSSAAAGAFTAMLSLSNGQHYHYLPSQETQCIENNLSIRGVDVSDCKTPFEKAKSLISYDLKTVGQKNQLENPDSRVAFIEQKEGQLINIFAECYQGLVTGDIERFTKKMWEIGNSDRNWVPFRRSNNLNASFGDVSELLLWEQGEGQLHDYAKKSREQLHDMHESGNKAWGKLGIAINRMRGLKAVPYYGEHFDNNVAVVFPKLNESLNTSLLSFFTSKSFPIAVRELDQALKVTNRTLLKVPFDADYWGKIAEEKYPNGLPKPFTNDPTQIAFHGHPVICDSQIHVAVARLLGHRWPAELNEEMELSEETRSRLNNCESLLEFSDKDGIVCIPAVRGEMRAEERLDALLAAAYGDQWSSHKKSELLTHVDHTGKSIESWLRDKFFTQHCKLFHHRPFIWQIWDGLNDGFSALVNYHKFDKKLLETLIYTYLGDWINRQKDDQTNRIDGAAEKLAAAENLKKKLELILEGEAPYDIFVRWKSIEEQPIGWNPDLNDGVRMNIRPFISVPDVNKKGAGVLRDKPNIKWGKDRGKDVETSPWYYLFKGDRINDHHLTLKEKTIARQKAKNLKDTN
jgi:hypothetical protein